MSIAKMQRDVVMKQLTCVTLGGIIMEYPVLDAVATGARIKELRKQRKIKVDDIRQFMGLESEQAIYKWQRGESLPSIDNLYALSFLFGTSIDSILVGTKEEGVSPLFDLYRFAILTLQIFIL